LLAALEEQKDYIFVPRQIVDEVMRNKLDYTRKFFAEQINEIETERTTAPDHLLYNTSRPPSDTGRLSRLKGYAHGAVADSLADLADSLRASKSFPTPARRIRCPSGAGNFAATL
jgi:hypothetical protein